MRWLAVMLAACNPTTEVTLVDLHQRRLHVGVSDGIIAELAFVDTGDQCPTLSPSFRATIDGLPIDVVQNDFVDDDTWCLFSPMQLRRDERTTASGPARLELSDDSLSIVAYLGDVLVPRQASLPSTTLAFDARTTVRWSPASDLERFPPRVLVRQSDSAWPARDLEIGTDTITFTVPSRELLDPGDAMFEIHMTPADDTLPCTHARCTIAAMRSDYVPVQLSGPL